MLLHKGYTYSLHRGKYWRCSGTYWKCLAKLILSDEGDLLRIDGRHTHDPKRTCILRDGNYKRFWTGIWLRRWKPTWSFTKYLIVYRNNSTCVLYCHMNHRECVLFNPCCVCANAVHKTLDCYSIYGHPIVVFRLRHIKMSCTGLRYYYNI